MIQTQIFSILNQPTLQEQKQIVRFLSAHLDQFGDAPGDINKAFNYAIMRQSSVGGFVITAKDDNTLVGAAIINKTGMEGYIPENILVYIATHNLHRGKGVASALMREIVKLTRGNIALHVEHNNPAIQLYQKFGFTNKYLEMRLNKKEERYGLSDA